MQTHIITRGGLLLLILWLSGCSSDYCSQYKLDQPIEVDFYFFGQVHFYDRDKDDITAEFAGKNFKLQFYKINCSYEKSPYFYYDYVLLEDGTLYRYQETPYSFTMENEEDHFELILYMEAEPGGTVQYLMDKGYFARYEEWKSGKLRAELTLDFQNVDPEENWFGIYNLIINYL